MKLSYVFWLNIGKYFPLNSDGKLIGEPYKGFIVDVAQLNNLEVQIRAHCTNTESLITQRADLEAKIQYNKQLWKNGSRW